MLLTSIWVVALAVAAVVPALGFIVVFAVVAITSPLVPLMRTLTYFEFDAVA